MFADREAYLCLQIQRHIYVRDWQAHGRAIERHIYLCDWQAHGRACGGEAATRHRVTTKSGRFSRFALFVRIAAQNGPHSPKRVHARPNLTKKNGNDAPLKDRKAKK